MYFRGQKYSFVTHTKGVSVHSHTFVFYWLRIASIVQKFNVYNENKLYSTLSYVNGENNNFLHESNKDVPVNAFKNIYEVIDMSLKQ